jgi:hypothetical protein
MELESKIQQVKDKLKEVELEALNPDLPLEFWIEKSNVALGLSMALEILENN